VSDKPPRLSRDAEPKSPRDDVGSADGRDVIAMELVTGRNRAEATGNICLVIPGDVR